MTVENPTVEMDVMTDDTTDPKPETEPEADVKTDEAAEILKDVTPPPEEPQTPSLDELTPEEQVGVLQETIVKLNEAMAGKDDEVLRYAAELQNTRRRAEKDRQDALKYGMTSFARDMVAVGDNLTRALNAIEDSDRDGLSENVTNLLEGVAATERDLMAALQRNNVKPLNPLGEKFDANYHEAMYEAPGTGQENGTVIEVVEIGFMIGERLLRAAKVGVAKG
ncbi:MAG: nucleotide exchange factor GrpE [Parvibaculales bacterium]